MTLSDELRRLADWFAGRANYWGDTNMLEKASELRSLAERCEGKVLLRPPVKRVSWPVSGYLAHTWDVRHVSVIGETEAEALSNLQRKLDGEDGA